MNWNEKNNALERTFDLSNFEEALNFINQVGVIAKRIQHHPDIHLFDYNKVKLTLTTHDEGGLTEKDYELARQIDAVYSVQ